MNKRQVQIIECILYGVAVAALIAFAIYKHTR